jgi:hypothetical protein
LNKQCVPLRKGLWRVAQLKEFLTQRRKLLAEQTYSFLGV